EERMVVPQDSGEMGIYAMVKAENGRSVNLILNCYNSRAGGMVIKACSLEAPRHGTFNWGSVYNSFSPPANGLFFDLWLKSAAADSGISRVWFDDAAVIKWGNWQTFNSPVETISPNEFTWIQIRTQMPVNQAEVWYEELGYQTQTGIKNFRVISAIQPGLSISPIPARKNVLIEYYLPKPGKVNLKVFNSAGQLVMGLVAQHKGAGKQIVRWNLRDSNGRRVSAGSYFFCLETAEGFSVIKAVLVNTD
ncbi:MAG: T9SS type A sorting domain-containing protein, partial [bacterium]